MTTTAIEQIIEALDAVFAESDKKVSDRYVAFALEAAIKVHAFKQTEEWKVLARKPFGAYEKLYALCGGKTNYNRISGNNKSGIEEAFRKQAAAVVKARNVKIANKLNDAGITQVLESKFESTSDGFNGFFRVVTDKGEKLVTVNTIIAGGPVQCVHNRVLVKVK